MPTPEDLIALNPALSHRSRKEIEELISMIEKCGWEWDVNRACFAHRGLGRSLRTQGLDMFTAERFLRNHEEMTAETQANPQAYDRKATGMYLWQRFGCLTLIAWLLTLAFGWMFLDVRTWIGVTIALFAAFVGLFKYARRGVELAEGDEK
jgi:hypothetical protein